MVAGLFVFLLDILYLLEMLLKSALSELKCLKLFAFIWCSSSRNSLDGTT